MAIGALSRLRRNGNKDLPPSPFFFVVNVFDPDEGEKYYKFATIDEANRNKWMSAIKAIGQLVEMKPRGEKPQQSVRKRQPKQAEKSTVISPKPLLPGEESIDKKSVTPGPRPLKHVNPIGIAPPVSPNPKGKRGGILGFGARKRKQPVATTDLLALSEEHDEDEEKKHKVRKFCCVGIQWVHMVRFLRVLAGFPFAIFVGVLIQLPPSLYWMKNWWFLFLGNLLWVFAIPGLLVQFVLREYTVSWIQRLAIGGYLLVAYGIPVLYHSAMKIRKMSNTDEIVDGAFTFRPSARVRCTVANSLQFLNFFFEWFQLVLMILPSNFISEHSSLYIESYPPYLPFKYYFWLCVGLVYLSAVLLMLLPVLRGKALYQFQKNPFSWNIIFAVGNFLFLPIVTIMFMSLWCDYSDKDHPTFLQDEEVACYTGSQLIYAPIGLVTLGFIIIQHVLLPAGTYKRDHQPGLGYNFCPKLFEPTRHHQIGICGYLCDVLHMGHCAYSLTGGYRIYDAYCEHGYEAMQR